MPQDRKRKVVEKVQSAKKAQIDENNGQKAKQIGNQGKQTRSKSKKEQDSMFKTNRTVARFEEETGNVLEMTAEGQSTEFVNESEEEGHSQSSDSEKESDSNDTSQSGEDLEVSFKDSQQNNNATMAKKGKKNKISDNRSEVGEESQSGNEDSQTASCSVTNSIQDAICQSLDKSLSKMQDYFEQRINSLEKAVEKDRASTSRQIEVDRSRSKGAPNDWSDGNHGDQNNSRSVQQGRGGMLADDQSVVTIYRGAVPKALSSQRYSSSDDDLRISDEFNTSDENRNVIDNSLHDDVNIVAGTKEWVVQERMAEAEEEIMQQQGEALANEKAEQTKAQQRATKLIQDAEAAKARIYEVAGKIERQNKLLSKELLMNEQAKALIIDESYKMIASHVDEATRTKIVKNEYVDFAKLIPRDRVLQEEDGRMIWMQKAGETLLMPASERDKDATGINSFFKWEQAFRVFSDIYLEQYPHKIGELLQYCHEIQSTSLHYAWENVYRYDREFRIHISKNPGRSWSVTLQKAWNMFMKDRTRSGGNGSNNNVSQRQNGYMGSGNGNGNNSGPSTPRKKVCFGFNLSKCTYGTRCKFDHRCMVCKKYGHGSQVCRKAAGFSGGNSSNKNQGESFESNDKFFKTEKFTGTDRKQQ